VSVTKKTKLQTDCRNTGGANKPEIESLKILEENKKLVN